MEREFSRFLNIVRLLKFVNLELIELIFWERINVFEKLIEYINNEDYEVYILFLMENDDLLESKFEYKSLEKILVFIILDGIWKEVRRILRKSDYLKNLLRVLLNLIYKLEYILRRCVLEGELCIIEVVIEVFGLNYEFENVKLIKDVFDLFIKSFKVGVNGLKLKE